MCYRIINTMESINAFLTHQGLNEKDRQVYFDIHRHGPSFVSSIALRTGIDRTTVYAVIKRLLRRGILAQTKIKDIKAYLAVSPEVFADKIEFQIESLKKSHQDAKIFAQSMSKIQKHSFKKPNVTIFEGAESVRSLYEQTLERNEIQKCFLTIRQIPDSIKNFLTDTFIREKIKKEVRSKVLLKDGPHARKYQALDRRSNRETRLVKDLPVDLSSEIIVFGRNKIAIIDFNDNIYGLLIESRNLNRTLSAIFDLVWQISA